MAFVDLHLHLLPGVDDGPATEDESVAHARRMAAGGVSEATVTPHVGHPGFPLDVATIAGRTARLQAALDAAGIALRLRPGGELRCDAAAHLTADELDLIAQGPPGARWVLLEPPFAGIDDAFLAACAAVRAKGFGLVVAHPERSAGFGATGLRRLRGELERGAVLQVNVCSLLGRHGKEARRTAERLVRTGLAWIMASDGHGASRPQTLRLGYAMARTAGASPTHAWRLAATNPRFLLRHGVPDIGTAVAAHEPVLR